MKRFFIDTEKFLMTIWDDSKASEDDYKKKQVDVALMESIKAVVSKPGSKSPSKTISNPNEISWGERLKHQSWDLVNGCSQRSKEEGVCSKI